MAELQQLFDSVEAKQYKRPDMNEDLRLGFALNDFAGAKWKNLTASRPVWTRWKPGRRSGGRRTSKHGGADDDFNVRDPRKLYRLARQRDLDVTQAMAFEALKADVGRQVQAPRPRALGTLWSRPTWATSSPRWTGSCPRKPCAGRSGPRTATPLPWWTGASRLATRVAHKGGQWSDHKERAAGAYSAAPRDGARRARGRGEAAGHRVQGPPRQRRQVPAQQGPRGPAREGGGGRGRLPSADERGEELQPSVRQRTAAGRRGLHDRPQHGGPGDPAEAGAASAARGGPTDETGQAGGREAAGRLPGASAQSALPQN